jgi:O-antigen/teichoic acid export membrane protein
MAEIARGSTLNLAGAAVSALTTLGLTVLVTREFSRPTAGAFFTAMSLFLILETTAVLGANSGLVYFIARLRSMGADRRIGAILRRALVPVLVSSTLAAAALLSFAHPLARAILIGRSAGHTSASDVATALRALAAALPFAVVLDTVLGATRGYRDMLPSVAVDRIGRAGLQLLAVLVAALLGTAALLAPLWGLAYVPCTLAGWIWMRRIRRRPPRTAARGLVSADASSVNPGRFWAFTAPRALASGAQVIVQRLDIVLVAVMRGPIAAAIYTGATRFLVLGQFGNAAISMAAQPQLSHLSGMRDNQGINTVYQTTTAWLVLLTWPLYLLALIFGPAALEVFGHSYRAGSQVMVILAGTMLLATACGQVDVVLISTGRSALSLANGLVALVVNVGVDVALIPRYGITGAAMGWAAAIAASNLIPLAQLARILKVHPFSAGTLLACFLSAVSFGLIPVVAQTVWGGAPAVQIVAVVAGCAAFAVGLRRWRERLQLALLPRPRLRRGGLAPVVSGGH